MGILITSPLNSLPLFQDPAYPLRVILQVEIRQPIEFPCLILVVLRKPGLREVVIILSISRIQVDSPFKNRDGVISSAAFQKHPCLFRQLQRSDRPRFSFFRGLGGCRGRDCCGSRGGRQRRQGGWNRKALGAARNSKSQEEGKQAIMSP